LVAQGPNLEGAQGALDDFLVAQGALLDDSDALADFQAAAEVVLQQLRAAARLVVLVLAPGALGCSPGRSNRGPPAL
jgi:hypothetical protein